MVKSSALRSVMYLPFLSFTITSIVIRCAFSLTVSSWLFGDCAGVADRHTANIASKHAGRLIRGRLIKSLNMFHLKAPTGRNSIARRNAPGNDEPQTGKL